MSDPIKPDPSSGEESPPAGTSPNPVAEAHRVLADMQARAARGELGPAPIVAPPEVPDPAVDVLRAEYDRLAASNPFAASRFYLQHSGALCRRAW